MMEKQNGLVAHSSDNGIQTRPTPESVFKEFQPLDDWQRNFAVAPATNLIKQNPFADNAFYLPVSAVENQLDEMFFGLWKTENFRWQVVANEIVGSVDLHVFHPIVKMWLVRTGVGSVMIQQDGYRKDELGNAILDSQGKKQKINPRPSDVDAKIKNTLVKDFPHLKAECLKNAAKSLGKLFGRDLNRKDQDTYQSGLPALQGAVRKRAVTEAMLENLCQRTKIEGVAIINSACEMFHVTPSQLDKLNACLPQ